MERVSEEKVNSHYILENEFETMNVFGRENISMIRPTLENISVTRPTLENILVTQPTSLTDTLTRPTDLQR